MLHAHSAIGMSPHRIVGRVALNNAYRAWYLLSATILLSVTSPVVAEPISAFTVAIVEANGNLVPVATFGGSGWSSPWPLNRRLDEITSEWPNLPEEWLGASESPRNWTLWFENSGPSASGGPSRVEWIPGLSPADRRIVADGLVKSEMGCSKNLALSTDAGDLRSSLISCDYCCPEPKRGVATTGAAPKLVERLEPGADSSRRMASRAGRAFDLLESQAIKREAERQGVVDGQLRFTGQWLDSRRRQAIPLRVQRAYRARGVNFTVSYLEISRPYGHSRKTDPTFCPGYSLLKTWVRTGEGAEFTSINAEFLIVDCDGKTATSDTPVVYWEHGTGLDLLVRRLGWESEFYAVVTASDNAVTERTEVFFRTME